MQMKETSLYSLLHLTDLSPRMGGEGMPVAIQSFIVYKANSQLEYEPIRYKTIQTTQVNLHSTLEPTFSLNATSSQ